MTFETVTASLKRKHTTPNRHTGAALSESFRLGRGLLHSTTAPHRIWTHVAMGDWMSNLTNLLGMGGEGEAPAGAPGAAPAPAPAGDDLAPIPVYDGATPAPAPSSAPMSAEDAEWAAAEGEDEIKPLPVMDKKTKPTLDVGKVGAAGGGDRPPSTRRRFTPSFFSSSSGGGGGGLMSSRTATKGLAAAIDALNQAGSTEGAAVIEASERLFALVQTLDKVALASKSGAIEAVCAAFLAHLDHAEVLRALFPPVINISAGDDEAGERRAERFIELGSVEMLSEVLRRHQGDVVLVTKSLWALQHLMRPAHAARPLLRQIAVKDSTDGTFKLELPMLIVGVMREYARSTPPPAHQPISPDPYGCARSAVQVCAHCGCSD